MNKMPKDAHSLLQLFGWGFEIEYTDSQDGEAILWMDVDKEHVWNFERNLYRSKHEESN